MLLLALLLPLLLLMDSTSSMASSVAMFERGTRYAEVKRRLAGVIRSTSSPDGEAVYELWRLKQKRGKGQSFFLAEILFAQNAIGFAPMLESTNHSTAVMPSYRPVPSL